MSMNEDDQGLHEEELDDEEGEGEEEVVSEEPKKSSKGVMIAAAVGAVAVFGFAGMQVVKKFSKPSAGAEQEMMAPVAPVAAPVQALVPAGAEAPVGQVDVGASASSPVPEMRMLSTSEIGGSATPAHGAQSTPVAASVSAGPTSPSTVALGAAAPQVAVSTSAPMQSSGPLDMSALNSLKNQQEAQGKRIDSFDARLDRIESRLTQLANGERVTRSEQPARSSWQPKKPSVKRSLVKVAKPSKTSTKVESVAEVKVDAPSTVKLPPAPTDIAKSDAKPEADKFAGRVTGLRIQAVIPGRAWVQEDGGSTRSFAVGDAVRAGVVIKSIDADKGVIETSAGAIR